jgi:hypothetical protein
LPKSHVNDAFVIAGGVKQTRTKAFVAQQTRRNNRSLEKFYDVKFIDSRTGKKASGQDLFNGRTKRNKNTNGESLRVFRGEKFSRGRRSIRRSRYPFQPKDLVLFNGKQHYVVGTLNKGDYVKLKDVKKVPNVKKITLIKSGKGLCFN